MGRTLADEELKKLNVWQLVQTYHNAVHASYEFALTMAANADKSFHKERIKMVEEKNTYVREIEQEISRRLTAVPKKVAKEKCCITSQQCMTGKV